MIGCTEDEVLENQDYKWIRYSNVGAKSPIQQDDLASLVILVERRRKDASETHSSYGAFCCEHSEQIFKWFKEELYDKNLARTIHFCETGATILVRSTGDTDKDHRAFNEATRSAVHFAKSINERRGGAAFDTAVSVVEGPADVWCLIDTHDPGGYYLQKQIVGSACDYARGLASHGFQELRGQGNVTVGAFDTQAYIHDYVNEQPVTEKHLDESRSKAYGQGLASEWYVMLRLG